MKLGCNTILPDGRLEDCATQFGRDMQIKSLELIAQAGFDAVEYSHVEHLSDDDLRAVAEATKQLGLIPWSSHAWQALPGLPSNVEAAQKELDAFIPKAQLLGVDIIVIHSGGNKDRLHIPPIKQRRLASNLECLGPLADKAGSIGAKIAVENGTTWGDWDFIIEMVKGMANPNVGLNIDTGHAALGDMVPTAAIMKAGEDIITTHLQDNHGKVDDHLPPGLGDIEWPRIFDALKGVGYDGVYMVEISDCPPNREPNAPVDIQTAHDNVAKFLGLA